MYKSTKNELTQLKVELTWRIDGLIKWPKFQKIDIPQLKQRDGRFHAHFLNYGIHQQ